MNDPFGCLQGKKISAKKIQEPLQKKIKSIPIIKKDLSLSFMQGDLIYVANEFCRACPKCGRASEFDDEQFQEENRERIFTANNFHLKSVLRKWNIYKMFSFSEVDFLGNIIAQFQKMSGKSVNYSCFLYNYFEKVPSECWPNKKEIMESISHHLPKSLVSWWLAKQEFDKWWLKTNQGSS